MDQVKRFRTWLRGEPDTVLTYWLLGIALVAVLLALFAPPELKAGAALWLTLP